MLRDVVSCVPFPCPFRIHESCSGMYTEGKGGTEISPLPPKPRSCNMLIIQV